MLHRKSQTFHEPFSHKETKHEDLTLEQHKLVTLLPTHVMDSIFFTNFLFLTVVKNEVSDVAVVKRKEKNQLLLCVPL